MARTHGKASTYRAGCRCADCRTASTQLAIRERQSRAVRLAADPTLTQHGIYTTYINWGCRCTSCTQANTDKCRAYLPRRRKWRS